MKTLRVSATAAAVAIAGGILASVPAHAAIAVQQPFAADSGDNCRYGSTEGVLVWRSGGLSPLPFTAVDVKGTVADRPLPTDPGPFCPDDGFFSVASFTAYAGNAIVAEQDERANNGTLSFSFTLAPSPIGTARQIDRIEVRVCRSPLVTLPPSYCGKPVDYLPPPVAAR